MKAKKCENCYWMDWDFVTDCHITPREGYHYCGLHGSARVEPEDVQHNFDGRGSCDFLPIDEPIQLTIDF